MRANQSVRAVKMRRIGQDRPRRLTQSGCNKEHLFVDREALRSCNARLEEEDGRWCSSMPASLGLRASCRSGRDSRYRSGRRPLSARRDIWSKCGTGRNCRQSMPPCGKCKHYGAMLAELRAAITLLQFSGVTEPPPREQTRGRFCG